MVIIVPSNPFGSFNTLRCFPGAVPSFTDAALPTEASR